MTAVKRKDGGSGHVLDDIDRAILAHLPDEGTKVGPYVPDAPTANEIQKRLGDPKKTGVRSNLIGSRLGAMKLDGLVVSKKPPRSGGTLGWQRTEQGKREAADAAEGGTAA